jgi:hypothetical protein
LTGQVRLAGMAAPVFSFLNCGGVIHGYPKMRGFVGVAPRKPRRRSDTLIQSALGRRQSFAQFPAHCNDGSAAQAHNLGL